MKIDRQVALSVLLAGLLFFAGFMLRDFLLVNFVKPMALLLWAGNRLIASIDQFVYWIGLIAALVVASLIRYSRQIAIEEAEQTENENATLNSIRHWRTLILLTSNEADRLNYFKRGLYDLIRDLYASRQPAQATWIIYEDLDQGDIKLPDSIRKFLMLDQPSNTRLTLEQRLQQVSQAPGRFLRHSTRQSQAEYYQSIAEVISFMEKQLENEDEQ